MSPSTWAAWLSLAPALVSLAAEASGQDEKRLQLIRLSAFGLLHPLPAYPLLGAALLGRRRLLAAAAALVAARHAALVRSGRQAAARTSVERGAECTVVIANLARDLPGQAGLARALLDLEPDVLLLQELTPATLGDLRAAGLPDHLAHRFEDPDEGYFGSAVYSRHPIVGPRVVELGQRRMVVTTLEVAGRPVTVVPVHTQAPVKRRDLVPWQTGFGDLGAVAHRAPGPVILAGDWNATWASRPFRRTMRRYGLRDAHTRVNRPLARTWPTHRRPVPPLLGLDRVVVSSEVQVLAVDEHDGPGTDHRIVRARLMLPT